MFTGRDLAGAIAFSSPLSLLLVAAQLPPMLAKVVQLRCRSPRPRSPTCCTRYAEYMDSGDFAGAAAFSSTRDCGSAGGTAGSVDADTMLSLWRGMVIVYPDGTPRTKHVVTNPIIEVDDDAGTATCRSYYTVLQQTDGFPLQLIVAAGTTTDSSASTAGGDSPTATTR